MQGCFEVGLAMGEKGPLFFAAETMAFEVTKKCETVAASSQGRLL